MISSNQRIAVTGPVMAVAPTLSGYASAQGAPQPAAPAAAPAASANAAAPPAAAPAAAGSPAAATPPAVAAPTDAAVAAAGDHPAPNSIYVEGLGAAILYSINYERVIADMVAVRGGFGYFSVSATAGAGSQSSSSSTTLIYIPITASYIGLRSGKHSLEVGAGVTFVDVSGSANGGGLSASSAGLLPYGVAMIGYRLHPVDHAGFQFRVGFNALFANGLGLQNPDPSKLGVIPWPYISLGASF